MGYVWINSMIISVIGQFHETISMTTAPKWEKNAAALTMFSNSEQGKNKQKMVFFCSITSFGQYYAGCNAQSIRSREKSKIHMKPY